MAGVKIYTVTPERIRPENRDRVLVQIHGGCYVLNPAEAALPEAMLIAAIGGYRVIAVDYRMPPEAYFPAALDDSMAVYKEVIAKTDPKRVGLIGTSAGGALVLEMGLRAKQLGLPLPGAIASGTPMSDSTKTGDSFYTNAHARQRAGVDRRLLRRRGGVLRQGPRPQGPADLADLRRHERLSADDPDLGHARSAAQQHGAGASQAAQPRHRFVPAGLRRPVARAVRARRSHPGSAGGVQARSARSSTAI